MIIDNVEYLRVDEMPKIPTFRESMINNPSNVMALFQVKEGIKELELGKGKGTEEWKGLKYDLETEEEYSMLQDLKKDGCVIIYKEKKEWCRISKELLNDAKKIIKIFNYANEPKIVLGSMEFSPILLISDNLGIIIAPRQKEDKEEEK